MLFSALADLVVVLHLVFIIFSVLGGLLVIWKKWIVWIHIPAAFWGTFIIILGWSCPLTPLEKQLRKLSGGVGYTGDFVAHYITPIIYPEGLTREVQINLGLAALVVNIVVYSYVIIMRNKNKNIN